MQRKTLILVSIIVVIAIGMLLFFRFFLPGGSALRVVVRQNGTVLYDEPLSSDAVIPVQSEWGYNLILIENGVVWMQDADCSDRLCIHQGRMDADNIASRSMGNTIVCLPHRLTITLESGK